MSKDICQLDEVGYKDIKLVGGKAASLGEMLQAGIAVPDGFVITTDAYHKRDLAALKEQLLEWFDKLGAERVAVRSSAVAEDSESASWAGQLDTVLNVKRDDLLEAISHCWDSMQSKRAQSYAIDHKIAKNEQSVAVVVQAMVDSEVSGVAFTANPTNGNRSETVIEAIYGLGELLVQGEVTPESFVINNKTGKVVESSPHRQTKKLIYKDGENQEVAINGPDKILSPRQLKTLLKETGRIEEYYGKPQDIEFAFSTDKLYIVQSRPITTRLKR